MPTAAEMKLNEPMLPGSDWWGTGILTRKAFL